MPEDAGDFANADQSPSIRERRIRLGISQRELGLVAGIDQTSVSDVELGRRRLGLGCGTSVAKVLSALNRLEIVGPIAARSPAFPPPTGDKREYWASWLEEVRPQFRRRIEAIVAEARHVTGANS